MNIITFSLFWVFVFLHLKLRTFRIILYIYLVRHKIITLSLCIVTTVFTNIIIYKIVLFILHGNANHIHV